MLLHACPRGPSRNSARACSRVAPRREPAEQLRHPVDPPGHHRCRQMMRAGHDVGDDFGFRRIRHRGLQHTHHRCRALAQPDRLAKHRRIALERRRPEPVGQHHRARRARAVVAHVEQAAQHRMQPHHLEIRSADDARADFARLAETHHGEADGREIAERAQGLDPRAQVLDFRHRERRVVHADAARALPDVDQPVLVAIDQRPQQHAAHQGEDGGVRPDAQRQRQDYGYRQPFGAHQRAHRVFQLTEEVHNRFGHVKVSYCSRS